MVEIIPERRVVTRVVSCDDPITKSSKRRRRRGGSESSDINQCGTISSQPDVVSSAQSPGRSNSRNEKTSSTSPVQTKEEVDGDGGKKKGLIPSTVPLSGSMISLNEEVAMDTGEDDMSPRRKVAGTWNFEELQPDEDEKKKKKLFDFRNKKRLNTLKENNPSTTNYIDNNSNSAPSNKQSENISNRAEISKSRSPKIFARRFGGNASILHNAIKNSDTEALEKLLQDANTRGEMNTQKAPGVTEFHQACVYGDVNIVSMLVSHGADLNLKTWSKLSPVKIAVTFGHFDVARLLLESGADQMDIVNGFQHDEPNAA